MRRSFIALAALLLLSALPALAVDAPDRTTVIDDIIRMTKAGVEDDAIIKFIEDSDEGYVVDADAIIALTDAKVSKDVLESFMDHGYRPDRRAYRRRDRNDDGTRTVYVRPYYSWDPWLSSYDPFWYGPRFSFGIGFGGYRHHGGYRHRH